MRRAIFIMLILSVGLFFGCNENLNLESVSPEKFGWDGITNVRLKFDSENEISELIEKIKENEGEPIVTKSNSNFISLNDHLRELTLSSLTDAEREEVAAEGLIFDPDDEVIADPYFCEVLNYKREIEVNGKIYKFTKSGIYRCDIEDAIILEDVDSGKYQDFVGVEGEFVGISRSLEFLKRSFENDVMTDAVATRAASGSNRGDLKLKNGEVINQADIRDMEYTGKGDAGQFQHWIADRFGENTVVEVNFSKTKRMKLRMFQQDYKIYGSIGMTVRMQKRKLRIWWRTKADEFRFGWKNMELFHEFETNPIPTIPVMNPQTGIETPTVPDYVQAKFPFSDAENVLFTIPFGTYKQFKMGDVNSLFWNAMNNVSHILKRKFEYLNQGAYSVEEKPEKAIIYTLVPQEEKLETDTGREVVRFDLKWFTGNVQIGASINPSNGNFKLKSISAKSAEKGGISRGEIYAAVRYDGEWKAARIYTN